MSFVQYRTVADRLAARATMGRAGCWIWTGPKIPSGYGYMSVQGSHAYVHRLSYEQFVGPIPAGLEIDHLCRNTSCLNPRHLEAVPPRVNRERTRRDTCRRGHAFDRTDGRGYGRCSTCQREYDAARWPRTKESAR